MVDLYRTIESPGTGTYKEKRSRFLGFAYPVSHEDTIREYLSGLQKEHHSARHCCYAWRLKPEKTEYRTYDDGEPSGSAGKPIYGQIVSRDLTDLLVVVVRYFGGVKLGVGGLIQAYRTAASEALDQTRIIECRVFDRLKLDFHYDQMNRVMQVVKEYKLDFEEQQFELQCSLILKSWRRQTRQVVDRFSTISGCKTEVINEKSQY